MVHDEAPPDSIAEPFTESIALAQPLSDTYEESS